MLIFFLHNIQLSPEGAVNSGRYITRREASRYIYPPLFNDPEGDSCFSIYQIRWIKKCFNFIFWNFREMTRHFLSVHKTVNFPRIFQVTGTNQNARKLLSSDLVILMLIIISYLSHLYNIDVEHQEQQWRTHGHPVARNLLNAEHASKQDEEA